jgi:hypothetical protein
MNVLKRTTALLATLFLVACSGGGEPTLDEVKATIVGREDFQTSIKNWLAGQGAAAASVKVEDISSNLKVEKGPCKAASGSFECEVRMLGLDCSKVALPADACAKMGRSVQVLRFAREGGKWTIAPVLPADQSAAPQAVPDDETEDVSQQGAEPPPPQYPAAIEDHAPGYDIADGSIVDVLGISLGMPMADAVAVLQTLYPKAEGHWYDDAPSAQDEHGNVASFSYRSRVGFAGSDGKGSSGNVYLNFTTSLSGSRVSSISRSERFDTGNQPGLPEFLAAMEAKYGPPTINLNPEGFIHFYHIWYEGKHVTMTAEQWAKESRNGFPEPSPARCRDIYGWGSYVFQEERREKYPGCTVVMDVTIFAGERDNVMNSLEIELTDYQRWLDDNTVADKYLRDQLTKSSVAADAAIKPAPTPAL